MYAAELMPKSTLWNTLFFFFLNIGRHSDRNYTLSPVVFIFIFSLFTWRVFQQMAMDPEKAKC